MLLNGTSLCSPHLFEVDPKLEGSLLGVLHVKGLLPNLDPPFRWVSDGKWLTLLYLIS